MAVDDELAMAAQLLLRDRFVLREEDPEGFFLVRRHERALREFFREKLGWTLLMNMRFYKLEKVPAAGAAYLGIEALQGPEDYALLACTLAFLEEQEQQLLRNFETVGRRLESPQGDDGDVMDKADLLSNI